MTRTRLRPAQRREQLLDLGDRLFATQPYERVHIEQVAEQAGVSRGLLYHYFPTKRAFLAALLERASARLAIALEPDPNRPAADELRRGVSAYLRHCRDHQFGFRAIHRGAASGDADVLAVIERGLTLHESRILRVLQPQGEPDPLLHITVRSWLMFLRTACLEWLDTGLSSGGPEVPAEDVTELCCQTLVGALLALPERARPPLTLLLDRGAVEALERP